MKVFNIKKLLVGIFIVVTFIISFISINLFDSKEYKIANWQVGNNTDVVSALSLPENIVTIDVSDIKKPSKYEAALIDAAVKTGMNRQELKRVFRAADKDGPKGKIPVYIEADSLEGVPVIIIVYKNAYNGLNSKLSDGQWVEIVEKKDVKVLFSKGSL